MDFNIKVTFSKILALLVLVASSWYSIANHDSSVLMAAMPVILGLVASKQFNDRKNNEKPQESNEKTN